jgi:hypothetical protein
VADGVADGAERVALDALLDRDHPALAEEDADLLVAQAVVVVTERVEDQEVVLLVALGLRALRLFKELPMEFAVEAQNLLAVSLEGAVG